MLSRSELSFKEQVDRRWTDLVVLGGWFHPLREALDAFVEKCSERVTGEVRVRLNRGAVSVVGRASPYSMELENVRKNGFVREEPNSGFYEYYCTETAMARRMQDQSSHLAKW